MFNGHAVPCASLTSTLSASPSQTSGQTFPPLRTLPNSSRARSGPLLWPQVVHPHGTDHGCASTFVLFISARLSTRQDQVRCLPGS